MFSYFLSKHVRSEIVKSLQSKGRKRTVTAAQQKRAKVKRKNKAKN